MAPTNNEHRVPGMTCSHCVPSVSEKVGEVAGVTQADVDLDAGRLTVVGDAVAVDEVAS